MQVFKKRNLILTLILVLLTAISFGLFFNFNKDVTVNADPISSNLNILPGLSVSVTSDNPACSIAVSVTSDQYDKLNQQTTGSGSFFNPYNPNPYYLAVVRVASQEDYYKFTNNCAFRTVNAESFDY